MKGIFRYLSRDYWRLRGILRDIKKAKDYYCTMVWGSGMCCAFRHVDIVKYRHGEDIYFRIPEFNSLFLSGSRHSYRDFWWPRYDRLSRIEAFDKLIAVYEDKIANLKAK